MSEGTAPDAAETEVGRALAELEVGRERVYYDAGADAAARKVYYAALDPDASPRERFDALRRCLGARTSRAPPTSRPNARLPVG